MTCVQTQSVVTLPVETMAGFDPQKRTRTKAAARYILFPLLNLLFSSRRNIMLSERLFSFFPATSATNPLSRSRIPLQTPGFSTQLSAFPGPYHVISHIVTGFHRKALANCMAFTSRSKYRPSQPVEHGARMLPAVSIGREGVCILTNHPGHSV